MIKCNQIKKVRTIEETDLVVSNLDYNGMAFDWNNIKFKIKLKESISGSCLILEAEDTDYLNSKLLEVRIHLDDKAELILASN